MEEYKYHCEKCNYNTNLKIPFDKHLKSTLHLTGKRKIRSDKKNMIFTCEKCNYSSDNEYNYKTHMLNNHLSKEERKKEFHYYCERCDFGCFSNTSYEKHIETNRHKIKAI